jgi:hypothetical protein
MPTYIVRPGSDTAPNDSVESPPHYNEVDDLTPDDDTTVVSVSGVTLTQENFGLLPADLDLVPAGERITSVDVVWRHKPGGGAPETTSKAGVRIGGTRYLSGLKTQAEDGAYADYSEAFALNPAKSIGWTRERLRATDLSFEWTSVPAGLPRARLTQLILRVNTEAQSKLRAIEALLLEQLSKCTLLTVFGKKPRAYYEAVEFPAGYLWLASEAKDRLPTRSKNALAEFGVHLIVKNQDDPLDEWLKCYEQIEEQIEDDPSLDGLALDARVQGADLLVTSETISSGYYVGDVFVQVEYRHERGNP